MTNISRRAFFQLAGGATAALAVPAKAQTLPAGSSDPGHAARSAPQANIFFRTDELQWISAATERLIPADGNGPGAREAGVADFIDRQLGGAWGAGERLYRSGPWQAGEPTQGYQLPFTPAELFRNALRGIAEDLQQRRGTTFDRLAGHEQDAYLEQLQHGKQDLHGVPAHVFFESLLALTIEGFFSDPVYGGNRGMASWKMIGFPGAYASFYDLVDQHGAAYTRSPISMGDNGAGFIHLHPVGAAPAAKGKS